MRRTPLIIIGIIVGLFAVGVVSCLFLLQSPLMINTLSALLRDATGYQVRVHGFSIDRHLRTTVEGLEITSTTDRDTYIYCASIEAKANLTSSLKVTIEKVVLSNPRFTFHLNGAQGKTNVFAALEKIPPVGLLLVENGSLEITGDGSKYEIPGIRVAIRNFSAKKGGEMDANGSFSTISTDSVFHGSFVVNMRMNRFAPSPSGDGTIRVFLNSGSIGPVAVERATLSSLLRFESAGIHLDQAQVTADSLWAGTGKERTAFRGIRASSTISFDQESSRFTVSIFQASLPDVGQFTGRCEGTTSPFSWRGDMDATSLDIPRIVAIAKPLLPEEYRSWVFKGKGAVHVQTEGRVAEEIVWSANVQLDLDRGGFASTDNLTAGEKITGRVQLKIESPAKKKGAFNLALNTVGGELLLGNFYRDFGQDSFAVTSQGSFSLSPFSLSSQGEVDLFRTGFYSFAADLSAGEAVLSLLCRRISHDRLYAIFAKDYVQQNYVEAGDVTVSGDADLDISVRLTGNTTHLSGALLLRNTDVIIPSSGISAKRVDLTLPFNLEKSSSPHEVGAPGESLQGSLSLDGLALGSIRLENLAAPILAEQNSFSLSLPLQAPLWGGLVRLTHFKIDRLLSPNPRVDTGLSLKNLDLAKIAGNFGLPLVTGTVEASLPSIVSEGGNWTITGAVHALVFEGNVLIDQLFAKDVLSRGRTFGGNVAFDNIDLETVTDKIEVGKMTGTIKGEIKDMTIEYGQPSRFTLLVETDNAKNEDRQISVDAIENLSLVSTGSSAVSAIMGSGLNRFFKEYPYQQIGIACSLENDVFSLRGTVHENGKEYLVKRGFLRGIDVVNQNPDNSISFKDMQERIGRIFRPKQGGKTTS
jgi:hypothetical protein